MKIAIDCRLIGSSGIGTFIENVVDHLVEDQHHCFVLIGNPDRLLLYRHREHCRIVACTYDSFTVNELFRFPTAVVNRCDAFYTPNFNIPMGIQVPIFSTIHDIVLLDTNHFGSALKKMITRWYLRRALHISRTVFTVSHFSEERIKATFPTSTTIIVVPNGISKELRHYAETHPAVNSREGIVYLGNLKKHKGIHTLIDAYDQLVQSGVKKSLTIIGRLDFRTKDEDLIGKIETYKDRIRFVTNADNEDVFRLMSKAEVLVSPSLYEGFGIPPLEAMYLSTPTIISDIPVYQEIYSNLPVTYFKAGDADDLVRKMRDHRYTSLHIQSKIDQLYNYQKTADTILGQIVALVQAK